MNSILTILHVFLSLGIIGLVLIQHGKGADAGAAFGGGSSSTVFGAKGAGSFLTKATGILAVMFFSNSLALAYLAGHDTGPESIFDKAAITQSDANVTTIVDQPVIAPAAESDLPPNLAPETAAQGDDLPPAQ